MGSILVAALLARRNGAGKIRIQNKAMSGMHVCYYSRRCRFCQAFFEELAKTDFQRELRFVCVDPSANRPPLPAWLKAVPALVVAGEDSPRVGPSAVNNWLFERRLLSEGAGTRGGRKDPFAVDTPRSGTVPTYSIPSAPPSQQTSRLPDAISASTPANSKQGPPVLSGAEDGPAAWHGAEMAGGNWSDDYSFLDEVFTAEKGVSQIIRNFELLDGGASLAAKGGTGGARGGGSSAPAVQRSAKEERLLREFEAFSKSRDMEFSAPQRMG